MKKRLSALIAVMFAVLFARIGYAGSATGQLQVSATVVAACTVSTTAVNFGNVTGQSGVDATGDVTVNCPANLAYNIALDAGQHLNSVARYVASGSYSASYFINSPAGGFWGDSGYGNTFTMGTPLGDMGTGSNQPHTVNAHLSNFSGIPAGTVLSDTITVTVIY